MGEQYQSMGPCACMGPQGTDPVCPCMMRQRGVVPMNDRSPEDIEKMRTVKDNWLKGNTK